MSTHIQYNMWSALKTQIGADTTLLAYVKRFKFNRQEEIFKQGDFPLLIMFPKNTIKDVPLAMPKRKWVTLTVNVFCKVNKIKGDDLEDEMLKFDEYVKNAIEKDLLLGGKTCDIQMGDSSFDYLDKEYAESSFSVELVSPKFTQGSR